MRVSYDRLWKLMKNNKMTKRDLAQAAGFSQYMMGQFTKNKYVSLKEMRLFVVSSIVILGMLLR